MEIDNLDERPKSSRLAIAAGVLAIVAGGGAYFYFVYQPETQNVTVAAKPPVVGKPQHAPAKPAVKPVSVRPTVSAPALPAAVSPGVSPNVSPAQQPVINPVASAGAPVPETAAEPAKPEPVVQRDLPKKRKAVTKPKQANKPEQVATVDTKPDTPDMSQQVAPQAQDVLLTPTPSPVEPVSAPAEHSPVEPAPVPAPIPAPVESVPVAAVEAAHIAAGEQASQRRGITPKYNDVMTAVLRGDREAAKELLDLGWWVDKPSANGVTPLMAAVMNKDTQMVQLLLEYGAAPSARALRLARKNKDAATATLLEQKGAR
ncbi:MAG: ankyrin repeat domain-containing protein [Gallionella sp.]|nr:ankyrin repeat domain-containing protein [Gallionella sp.]